MLIFKLEKLRLFPISIIFFLLTIHYHIRIISTNKITIILFYGEKALLVSFMRFIISQRRNSDAKMDGKSMIHAKNLLEWVFLPNQVHGDFRL